MKNIINIKNVFAIALIGGLLSACTSKETNSDKIVAIESSKIQNVEVVTPGNRSFTSELLTTGTAEPNQMVTLYAMESGILTQMRKDIGDQVKKGEVVAVLENPAIDRIVAQAAAKVDIIKADLKVAKADLTTVNAETQGLQSIAKRLNDVYKKTPQLTSISQVESASADASAAQARIASQQAKIDKAMSELKAAEVELQLVKKQQSFLNIRAPFSGTITKRFVDKGAMIQNGLVEDNPQGIAEIQDMNPIRLSIPVPESDAVAIKNGMAVQVTFPELGGEMYPAKISRTSNALDPLSKTMQVEVDLKNTDGKIITGMYAKILMQIASRENILSLPIIAKVKYRNEDHILVVENKKVKRIPIKIGLSDKDFFEVLNPDITKTTQVIINGKSLVNPGQTVEATLKSVQ